MKYFLILVLLLSGCSTFKPPSPEQLTNADYGVYPENYREIVESKIKNKWFGVSPVLGEMKEPQKMWVSHISAPLQKDSFYGYGVCVSVKYKNRLGYYDGNRTHLVLIHNNEASLHFWQPVTHNSYEKNEATEKCHTNKL